MQEKLRRKLTQVPMEDLTKKKSWEKIAEVLKDLGYEENPRRLHARLLKEYFKLSLRHQETYDDLLLREETLASLLKEREHPYGNDPRQGRQRNPSHGDSHGSGDEVGVFNHAE